MAWSSPPSAPLSGTIVPLFRLTNADMNSTADQVFAQVWNFTNCLIREVVAAQPSSALMAVVGGIYNAAAKGGTAIVAGTQSWAGLSAADGTLIIPLTLAGAKMQTTFPLYLSLSTGKGSAATLGSITIMGYGT